MHYIEFVGDVRLLTARAIEAVTGEKFDTGDGIGTSLSAITLPTELVLWRGNRISFFCPKIRNDHYSILHHDGLHRIRPWSKKYPTAQSICDGLPITITLCETKDEWSARVCRPITPKIQRILE